jgi:hypothetical protein
MKRLLLIILLLVAPAALARNLWVPAGGAAQGLNNTYFRTDLRLFNPSSTFTLPVTLHFLPQGMDGSNISGRIVFVPPRQSVTLENVVGNFLQWPLPAIGAIRIDSDNDQDYPVIATSRTYTDSPNPAVGGTYGQFVPALEATRAVKTSIVLNAANSAAFRTNAGAMNPNRTAATVTFSLVFENGALVAPEYTTEIPAMSMIQISLPAMFGTIPAFNNAFLHVDSTEPVFSFLSTIDNASSDQVFVLGVEDDRTVKPLP